MKNKMCPKCCMYSTVTTETNYCNNCGLIWNTSYEERVHNSGREIIEVIDFGVKPTCKCGNIDVIPTSNKLDVTYICYRCDAEFSF